MLSNGLEVPNVEGPRPSFPIEMLKGVLPEVDMDPDMDVEAVATSCIGNLERLEPQHLSSTAVWRDLYAMTGTLRTFSFPNRILPAWEKTCCRRKPYDFRLQAGSSKIVRIGKKHCWVQARFTFKTATAPSTICSGHIGILSDEQTASQWKIWLVTTTLEKLEGIPSPDYLPISDGLDSAIKSKPSRNAYELMPTFDCVVVGGGFSGLCLGGRLRALGLDYVILERNSGIGHNWLNRYKSARCDFPFEGVFSDDDPYFLDSQSLARGFERFATKHDLNIWLSTMLISASYDEDQRLWTLQLETGGKCRSICSKHLVLSLVSAARLRRSLLYRILNHSEEAEFDGTLLHSVQYKDADCWKGQHGVVIGTANTGHDVAADMVEAGLCSVTMIQRSRTPVFPIETYSKWSGAHYNGIKDIEESDRDVLAFPVSILRRMSLAATRAAVDMEYDRFDALERANFKVERYCDIWKALVQHYGGHYQDVGCSAKIAAGLITIKNDAVPIGYTQQGIEFSDGSHLRADVVICCTGFENDVRKEATKLFGPSIASQLDDYWGLDDEGEIRGVFRETKCPGLWYTGGGVNHARFFSRFIALAIKAERIGQPLQVYDAR